MRAIIIRNGDKLSHTRKQTLLERGVLDDWSVKDADIQLKMGREDITVYNEHLRDE